MDYDEDNEIYPEDDFPEDYEFADEENETLMGYGEMRERGAGGADIMGTTIEGTGALAKAQERIAQRAEGVGIDRKLLAYFSLLKNEYKGFAPNDQQLMFDRFHSLKHYEYKNPYAFLLAYIAQREDGNKLTKKTFSRIMNIARATDAPSLSEADVIRYFRLLKGNK